MKGGLHSSRSHVLDVQDVFEGRKPVALVNAYAASKARDLGLAVEPVPEGTFDSLAERLAYVVYRPGEPEAADGLFDTFSRYPIGRRGEKWHRSLGRLLGYPDEDVDYFVSKDWEGRL